MRVTVLVVALLPRACSGKAGPTSVANDLNRRIKKSGADAGIYRGGAKGIIVRSPFDGMEDSDQEVAPATLWHNDIVAPTQLYPGSGGGRANIFCPHNGFDGFQNIDWDCPADPNTGERGPWNYAQMGVVLGTAMPSLFYDYDNLDTDTWGWGVFYATDANAADKRCRYVEQYKGWDCPGAWIYENGAVSWDSSKKGAGYYGAGNPQAGYGGGGAGCHFSGGIDQTDAVGDDGQNLVSDAHCQCNYQLKGDSWGDWLRLWLDRATPKPGWDFEGWFAQGKAPSWAVDVAACWMNNPTDMIFLQNTVYLHWNEWNNHMAPMLENNNDDGNWENLRRYWGWNEIPMDRQALVNSQNWDTAMISLPVEICATGQDSISCLSAGAQQQLENDLSSWVSSGYLVPGSAYVSQRPGAYIVVVSAKADQNLEFQHHFFCEDWASPGGQWQIVYNRPNPLNLYGACYLDYGAKHVHYNATRITPILV